MDWTYYLSVFVLVQAASAALVAIEFWVSRPKSSVVCAENAGNDSPSPIRRQEGAATLAQPEQSETGELVS